MSQQTNTSFEERLRARITPGTVDVPIFTTAFERNHGPSNPQVIFQQPAIRSLGPKSHVSVPHVDISALRGDPGRGQTPGFPHRVEEKRSVSALYEEPGILTFTSNTSKLVEHLQSLHDLPVPKTISESVEPSILDTDSRVTIAPPTWRPVLFVEPTWTEKITHVTKRIAIISVSYFLALLSLSMAFFGWVIASNLPSMMKSICARYILNILRGTLFSISSFFTLGAVFLDIESIVGRKILAGVRATLRGSTSIVHSLIALSKQKRQQKWKLILRVGMPSFPKLPTLRVPVLRTPLLPAFPTLPKISLPKISFSFPGYKQVLGGMGQLMVIASIVLFLMTGGPIIRLQVGDWWEQSRAAITGKAAEPIVKQTLTDTVRKPDEVPPAEKQFQLEIPKIGANLRVIPNVDAGDEAAYTAALKLGVAHAAGSGLPGEPNLTNRTVYIFGHSTNAAWNIEKYNALFYSLKDMVIGDDISLWFWGKEFHYKVTNVVKIDPSDLTYLAPQTVKDQLILQTCWPPGTVWKRLLVIAEPVK